MQVLILSLAMLLYLAIATLAGSDSRDGADGSNHGGRRLPRSNTWW